MKDTIKKIYNATIGKKTVTGGIMMILGGVVGGPIGLGIAKVGEIVLYFGLGDKAVRKGVEIIKQKKQ